MKSLTLTYPAASSGRIPVFDELRGLAILLVLTYHVGGVTLFPNKVHGELGVDIFLFVSGAAMMLSHRPEESAWVFLWRRLARLLPAYWIALTLYWQCGVHLLNRVHNPVDIWSHYLCIHPWWGDQFFMSISDSFWFLGLIVPLYFVFALLRRWRERLDILVGVGLIFSFALACWTYFKMGQPAVFVQLGIRPSTFFFGLILGELLRTGTARIPLTGWLALGLLLTFYGMFLAGILIGYAISGLAIGLAYFISRANAGTDSQPPKLCRVLGWLGVYSYEIFLLHQPLIREYNYYVQQNILKIPSPSLVQVAVGVAVALVVTFRLSMSLNRMASRIGKFLSPRAAVKTT